MGSSSGRNGRTVPGGSDWHLARRGLPILTALGPMANAGRAVGTIPRSAPLTLGMYVTPAESFAAPREGVTNDFVPLHMTNSH